MGTGWLWMVLASLVLGACSGESTPSGAATETATPRGMAGPPKQFLTLPPGAALPSSEECAERVFRSGFEHRPANAEANRLVTRPQPVRIDGANDATNNAFAGRVDGRFTGTTDEIIQWASCKWGFDEDLMRARAVEESSWRQSQQGDLTAEPQLCAVVDLPAPCAQSYGLFQVKVTVHDGTYPRVVQSTAYNADYSAAWLRACFEGGFDWLGKQYRPGDVNGCVGAWFSGLWYDEGARSYLGRVNDHLEQRRWEAARF